jgi:hypothetical protein
MIGTGRIAKKLFILFLNHDYTEADEEDEIKNTLNSSSSSASV